MNKTLLFVTVLTAIACACKSTNSAMEAVGLTCGLAENPVGINSAHPVLRWELRSAGHGGQQSAYRIMVATSKEQLNASKGDLWDTGKTSTGIQTSAYEGEPLIPGREYWWKVMVWDEQDHEGPWSAPARFITGLWEPADWNGAQWIGYEAFPDSLRLVPGIHESDEEKIGYFAERLPVIPHFRSEIHVREHPLQAVLHVSGLGHYASYINGETIDGWSLVPGWTDYEKTVLYDSYDITDLIQSGENCIGFTVGNGFHYINRQRYWKLLVSYGFPKLIFTVHVDYHDGTRDTFVSGERCKTAPSPVTFSSIYGGEDFDSRLVQPGWNAVGFDDSGWKDALPVEAPQGKLIAEEDHVVQVCDTFPGRRVRQMEDGAYLYDFGQNASGIISLTATGPPGAQLQIMPGEVLDDSGNLMQCGGPYSYNYIFSGDASESWLPLFTYYGFRYARVTLSDETTTVHALSALHSRNGTPQVGYFACSDTLFNKIHALIRWAMRSNMASVPTDCPHREKLGWLEQCYLVGPSLHYNYDVYHLYKKLVRDMMDSQLENGLVPDIAPEYVEFDGGFRDSPEWGAASVLVPWYLYTWYGDRVTLEKAYPMMRKYVDYLHKKSEGYILDYGLGDWYDLGPEKPGRSQLTPKALTATAIFYEITRKLAEIAHLQDKPAESEQLNARADSIYNAFNLQFFDPDGASYGTGSQTSLAMPLSFGLVPSTHRDKVLRTLLRNIEENDYALTAGDIGYHFLVKVLSESGNSELLYKMNNRSDRPGYGYQLAMGATALTESWQALKEDSNNHMMLGHLMEWFYSGLGGIRQEEGSAGYERVVIAPVPVQGMDWVKTSYASVRGTIRSEWQVSENAFTMQVGIPANTEAIVFIPKAHSGKRITVNGKAAENAPGVRQIIVEEGNTRLKIGGGDYAIQME